MSFLFGKKQTPEAVSRMPDPNDPRILESLRRRQEAARRRGGRLSTILSDELASTRTGTTGSRGLLGA